MNIPTNYNHVRNYVGSTLAFIIERTTNQNVMVYQGNVKNNKLDPEEPIKAYWIDFDPNTTGRSIPETLSQKRYVDQVVSGIKFWEYNAYGFRTEPVENTGHYRIIMNAFPNRDIVVTYLPSQNVVCAQTLINGQPCWLRRVYAKVSGLTPEYVVFEGYTLSEPPQFLRERLKP